MQGIVLASPGGAGCLRIFWKYKENLSKTKRDTTLGARPGPRPWARTLGPGPEGVLLSFGSVFFVFPIYFQASSPPGLAKTHFLLIFVQKCITHFWCHCSSEVLSLGLCFGLLLILLSLDLFWVLVSESRF